MIDGDRASFLFDCVRDSRLNPFQKGENDTDRCTREDLDDDK